MLPMPASATAPYLGQDDDDEVASLTGSSTAAHSRTTTGSTTATPHKHYDQPDSNGISADLPAKRKWVHTLLLGQLISLLLTGTSVFTSLLVKRSWNIPVLQNVLNYALLTLHLVYRAGWFHRGRRGAATAPRAGQYLKANRTEAAGRLVYGGDRVTVPPPAWLNAAIDPEIAAAIDADLGRGSRGSSLARSRGSSLLSESAFSDRGGAWEPAGGAYVSYCVHPRCCPLRVSPWRYCAVAVADVMANYLIVKAYQDTSLASAMLLDCFALPCCAILSFCFLGARYSWRHCVGVVLCVAGLALNVVSDTLDAGGGNGGNATAAPSPSGAAANMYPNALRGDMLVVAAAALYAVSNVAQEKLVKNHDRVEFLGMLGACGTALCAILLASVERAEFDGLESFEGLAVAELTGFVVCLFAMYVVTSKFLQDGDALFFNLSTLTSDVYGVAFQVLVYRATPHWLYGVAFGCVVAGVLVYGNEPLRYTGVEAEKEEEGGRAGAR